MQRAELIRFSSLRDLEEATLAVGLGQSVVFNFSGECKLEDAAAMYRFLADYPLWEFESRSLKILRRATHHFDLLDDLETCLQLAQVDLKGRAPMQGSWFDNVRTTANAVVTTAAGDSSALGLLDNVTIDAQRLGRVCRGLMFGGEDVPVAALTGEDLDWLLEDGAGSLPLAADVLAGGELLPDDRDGTKVPAYGDGVPDDDDGGKLRAYDDDGQVLEDTNRFGVLADLVDGDEALAVSVDPREALAAAATVDGGEGHPGSVNGGKALAVVAGPLLLADEPLRDQMQVKAETVVRLMQVKILKILEAIACAKASPVTG